MDESERLNLEEAWKYTFVFDRKIVADTASDVSKGPSQTFSISEDPSSAVVANSSNWSLARPEEKIVSENEAKQYELNDSLSLSRKNSKKRQLLRRVSSLDGNQLVYRVEVDTEKSIITAGTLKKLLEALADETRPDIDFADVFLLCHRHIISSEDLLCYFIKRFVSQSLNL